MSAGMDDLSGVVLDGRYRIVERLASGGMATVYRGVDERLEREVALKILRPNLAEDEAFVARFRREARAAARLSHPNVVAVTDQGEDQGHMFIVMEYVPGPTLREALDAHGALDLNESLRIANAVASALAAAHRAGLIHRDIKPENVILGADGTVKVADFGLARAVTGSTTTAGTGILLGTVAYLAPEQVEGEPADTRSDVYSFGLVLFEMVTGGRAFTGENPIHIAFQHVHGGVPRPSDRRPGLPSEIDDLVARFTSRVPGERPTDGAAVLETLVATTEGRYLAGPLDPEIRRDSPSVTTTQVISAPLVPATRVTTTQALELSSPPQPPRPSSPVADAPELARRRRPWWTLVTAALIVIGAIGGGSWYLLYGPGAPVTIPAVDGRTFEQAQQELAAVHLTGQRDDVYSEDVALGIVVSSDPVSGKSVARGTEVILHVSKGKERYAVPELADKTQDQASAALAEVHLTLGDVSRDWSQSVPEGQILSSDPPAGEQVKRDTPVSIVVSKGREPIDVPSVRGLSQADAEAAISDVGLTVAVSSDYSDTVSRGAVISQSPSSGTLFRGDTVNIVVSKGPRTVTMPNVVGKQLTQAKAELAALGLKVAVENVLGGYFGTVRSQSQSAGAEVPVGSTITLTVI